ncbi:MAG: Cof-type HAD-IIB family hydrolase [Desulfitobacteriaceae bacterium]
MAIRLIAMDLDDTLLRNDLTISPRVVRAIRQARERGIVTTIATGRTPASMRQYAEQLGIDVPVITFHGALIQQVLSGEVLFRRVVASPLAHEIVKGLLKNGVHVQLYIRDRVLVQEESKWSEEYGRMSGVLIEQAELLDVLAQEKLGAEKILLIGEEQDLDLLAPSLQERYGHGVHLTKSKPHFLEMIDSSVNKGVALEALAKRYGIAQEEVMAMGDSYNDLEMIRYAGLGVAMGNARSEVREVADIVTSTNEEDGVAEAIERYVLHS